MILSIQALLTQSGLNKAVITMSMNSDDTMTLMIAASDTQTSGNIPQNAQEMQLRAALATPLVLTGTAHQIENEIGGFLMTYSESVAIVSNALKTNLSSVSAKSSAAITSAPKATKKATKKTAKTKAAPTPVVSETVSDIPAASTTAEYAGNVDTLDIFSDSL